VRCQCRRVEAEIEQIESRGGGWNRHRLLAKRLKRFQCVRDADAENIVSSRITRIFAARLQPLNSVLNRERLSAAVADFPVDTQREKSSHQWRGHARTGHNRVSAVLAERQNPHAVIANVNLWPR